MCIQFLASDPRRAADMSDYLALNWGVGRDNYLKGYAVLRLGEKDVGNRSRYLIAFEMPTPQ